MKNKGFRLLSVFFLCLFVSSVLLIKPAHILLDPHCSHTCESDGKDTENTKAHDCGICHFYFDTFSFQNTDNLEKTVYVCLGEINIDFDSEPLTKTSFTAYLRAPPVLFSC